MKKMTTIKHWLLALAVAFPAGAVLAQDYPVSFSTTQGYTHGSRRLSGATLAGSSDGAQTVSVPTETVYVDATDQFVTARPGDALTVRFNFTTDWMHGYVYLDYGNDGQFDALINDDKTLPAETDIVAFSYYKGKNSTGAAVSNSNVLNPPAFTLPADLPEGMYRLRFKVDWDSVDPAGSTVDGNGILKNGGGIFDVLLNVHGEHTQVVCQAENGQVSLADGTALGTTATALPFGQSQRLRLMPAEGYRADYVRIRHGHNLTGEQYIHGNRQWEETTIPAYLIKDGLLDLPAAYMDGEVNLEVVFVPAQTTGDATTDYPLAFAQDASISAEAPALTAMKFQGKKSKGGLLRTSATATTAYLDLTPQALGVIPGDSITITMTRPRALDAYLYIDLDGDGQFSVSTDAEGRPTVSSELIAFAEADDPESTTALTFPKFALHPLLPAGMYRARMVVDRGAVTPEGSAALVERSGLVMDFLINVYQTNGRLRINTTNGSLNGANYTALPYNLPAYRKLDVVPTPAVAGFAAKEVTIRRGHNLQGEQYIHGNRQWSEYTVAANRFSIPADSIYGDMILTADFAPTEAAEYELVFADEFDGENGTQEDDTKWIRCQRMNATWNRWCSDRPEVVYHEDGELVIRAIPNPDPSTDNVPMITGGVKTMGKFGFTYGKVECRAFTNPWIGNFPAIWMMPEDQSAGWPSCGEIDIWETIDDQHRSWHTVHSHWTYDLKNTGNPQSGGNEATALDRYHTYGLEWDEAQMRWYVDGKLMFTYSKSTDAETLENGQWPFDKHFHLMINQSVGNGAWAKPADVSHTYETRFDWIRVYQKKGQSHHVNGEETTVGIHQTSASPARPAISVIPGAVKVATTQPQHVQVYDMSGRLLHNAFVDGTAVLPLSRGLYLVGGSKVLVP